MSKCSRCGRDLVTGDVHWDMGLCNMCWNFLFEQAKQKEPITMQSLGNWAKCPDCEEKDHRIAVLEKALELACREHKIFGYCCYSYANCGKTDLTCEECCAEDFIKQAEKELEGKE